MEHIKRIWKAVEAENICPLCQSIRLACAAMCGVITSSSFGGFAATSVVAFFLAAYLSWLYRHDLMVWFIKARIWFAQRRSGRASSPTTGNGPDGAANSTHGNFDTSKDGL